MNRTVSILGQDKNFALGLVRWADESVDHKMEIRVLGFYQAGVVALDVGGCARLARVVVPGGGT